MKNYQQLSIEDYLEFINKGIDDSLIKEPLAVDIYKHLKRYHKGRINAVKGNELADFFGIEQRTLRRIIKHINSLYDYAVIESSSEGYWCWDGTEEDRSNMNFVRTKNQVMNHVQNEVQYNQIMSILFQLGKEKGFKLERKP